MEQALEIVIIFTKIIDGQDRSHTVTLLETDQMDGWTDGQHDGKVLNDQFHVINI